MSAEEVTFDISPEDLAAKGMGLLEGIKWKNEQKRLLAAEAKKRAGIQVFDDDGIDWSCEVCTQVSTDATKTTFLTGLRPQTDGVVSGECELGAEVPDVWEGARAQARPRDCQARQGGNGGDL